LNRSGEVPDLHHYLRRIGGDRTMHTLRHGPRMKLVTNTNRKEKVMEKLQATIAPPVILADKTASEKEVENWYRNNVQVRNVILEFANQHPNGKVAKLARSLDLDSYPETFPAPPVIREGK